MPQYLNDILDQPTAKASGATPPVAGATELPFELQGLPQVTELLDVDTVLGSDGGGSYRVQGIDAPEVAKVIRDDETGETTYKPGTAGGTGSLKAFQEFMDTNGPF